MKNLPYEAPILQKGRHTVSPAYPALIPARYFLIRIRRVSED